MTATEPQPIRRAADDVIAARKAVVASEHYSPVATAEFSDEDGLWTSPTAARFLPAKDEDTAIAFDRAVAELGHLSRSGRGALNVMRSYMEDGVKGAHYPTSNGERERTNLWCLTHERSYDECLATMPVTCCAVESVFARPDPTSVAALTADRAAVDYRAHLKDMATIDLAARRMSAREAAYPANASVQEQLVGIDVGPGDDHCLNCWRAKILTPIETRKQKPTDLDSRTEVPYYKGHCRWCGNMHSVHGIYPTPSMCVKHDERVRVTPGEWLVAKNIARLSAKKNGKRKH